MSATLGESEEGHFVCLRPPLCRVSQPSYLFHFSPTSTFCISFAGDARPIDWSVLIIITDPHTYDARYVGVLREGGCFWRPQPPICRFWQPYRYVSHFPPTPLILQQTHALLI